MGRIRTYSQLIRLKTFEDRFQYLKLVGVVGETTFGFDRYLNQALYSSKEWKSVRDQVIIRDNGCDLGIEDRLIGRRIVVHHMNPITIEAIENADPSIFDPEFLICTTENTHRAIHFGDESQLVRLPKERTPGDTKLW